MDDLIRLDNDHLAVTVDLGRGADILSLVHSRSGIDVLFSSPWRQRADDIRLGTALPSTNDPVAGWLEQYRGGWQMLCPNAGPPRTVHGAPVGFHGEASVVRWRLVSQSPRSVALSTELFAVPVKIDRELSLGDDTPMLTVIDTLTNLSDVELEFDYSTHPALGEAFLNGDCTIDTGATLFTSDPDTESPYAAPGSTHDWPYVTMPDGSRIDLRRLPLPGQRQMVFGWLSAFTEHWASLTNADLGLTVRLDWDGTHLPYAWLWQEFNYTDTFPWFRRARVMAIEPASTQTSGPHRASVLRLRPYQAIQLPISVSITTDTIDHHSEGAA